MSEFNDESLFDMAMRFAIPEPNTGCWLWMGAMDWSGYGRNDMNGKTRMAHRWLG